MPTEPTPLPLIRGDRLLLAMDVVAFLAQEPDQRGLSPQAVQRIIVRRPRWLLRPGDAHGLFEQLIFHFRRLWARRAMDGVEDHYNVVPFLEHLRLMPKTRPGKRAADGFERLLHAIVTGEVTEAEFCGGESASQQPGTRNDGGD